MVLTKFALDMGFWTILALSLYATAKHARASFGYSRRMQHTWPRHFKTCAGKFQSPIPISSFKSVVLPLPALEMNGYHDYLSGAIGLKNNGHSVALSINKETSRKRLPYVFGAMLNTDQEYELEGLHFHWGMKNDRGSEHVLNGVRFPMEMHIIHRNMKYSNLAQALEHKDGLTVLAIFFQLQEEHNDDLWPIVKNLANIRWIDSEEKMNGSFTLKSLMPEDTDVYYTYRGSLTTPPCNEVVTWIVFSTPVPISFKQMEKFRIISNGETIMADNYRRLQDVGNRKIYVRRLGPSFANDVEMINLNVTQLDWYWR
ncbi:carbonic anhydrase 7-like isoform X2 [Venturia canescens]|uniref:carbonic anhydrase 7-like isoform X2 n=1 Tax=Venturia canescens TaxID=32260 RepID=UPI001C9D0486|nr:carbonic anhydrase 7-like isoform X2 [Venturia canescens]